MHYVPCIKFRIITFAVKAEHPGMTCVVPPYQWNGRNYFLPRCKEREITCHFFPKIVTLFIYNSCSAFSKSSGMRSFPYHILQLWSARECL